MGLRTTQPASGTKPKANKLVLGFAALAATAVIGTTGVAAAQVQSKPTKEQCTAAGYTNYGQCVRNWAHDKNKGSGYGGGNTNNGNVSLDLNVRGDNNVINIIINLFQ
jgi:hypothetical protein